MIGNTTAVWIFRRFDPRPIYHLPGWEVNRLRHEDDEVEQYRQRTTDNGIVEETLTPCGRVATRWSEKGGTREFAQMLRWDHARKIGRMCEQCARLYYGDGRGPGAGLERP